MTLAPSVFLALLACVVCIYWALPARWVTARAIVLVAASSIVVFLISPAALFVAVVTALTTSALSYMLASRPSRTLVWSGVAAIIAILVYSRLTPLAAGALTAIDLAGSAFFALKGIAILSDAYRFERRTRPLDALVLILFFPTYEAGPIEQPSTLNAAKCEAKPDVEQLVSGVSRILIGLAKQSYLAPVLIGGLEAQYSPWTLASSVGDTAADSFLLWLILKWLVIYIMFSGYSDVAIGSARLFGIKIRENFNFPFLARNLQDFWKRWHISLIDFMSGYVYQPFVRRTGWRFRGILVLFLLTGLWHAFNPQYLLWGLLHGTAMIAMARWQRSETGAEVRRRIDGARPLALAYGGASRVLTLLFVVWVSAIGSSETWERALFVFTLGAI